MAEYMSKYFINVAGVYIEIDNKGNIVPGKKRMVYNVFNKYLESFCCNWELYKWQIKTYKALICQEVDIPGCYNTAKALNYSFNRTPLCDKERDLIKTFDGHMVTTCCQGDRTKIQHLIDMLALKLLYPFESVTKIGQGLVVIGEEGTCNFFNKLMQKLFGYKFVYTDTFATLPTCKNLHIVDTLIYQIDDGGAKMHPTTDENIKRIITEPTINALHTDEIPHPNYAMVIITANEWDRVLTSRYDNRYFVLEMATTHNANMDYHGKLYAEIEKHSDLIVRWILSQYSGVEKLPTPPVIHRTALEIFLKKDVEYYPHKYFVAGRTTHIMSLDVLKRYNENQQDLSRKNNSDSDMKSIKTLLSKYTTQVKFNDIHRNTLFGGGYTCYFENVERFNDFKRFLGVNEH